MQSEFELIESIKRYAGVMPAGVIGIGDDCAVIEHPDGSSLLITVDTMV
ncbi:thiamine-phosphate kinase, partial [bacterium]|nr:thiamine-phosphate kinase [bacterium]